MITEFRVENFKSIQKLSIPLGRVNVFIGENGSGKSNILEALALVSAAIHDKLNNEFLATRGIRVTSPELMRSAFDYENRDQTIKLGFFFKNIDEMFDNDYKYELSNDNQPYSIWKCKFFFRDDESLEKKALEIVSSYSNKKLKQLIKLANSVVTHNYNNITDKELVKLLLKKGRWEISGYALNDFLIYSPENTSLRTFQKEGQIEPLGIYGEGLFKFLRYLAGYQKESLEEIKNYLKLFAWFKDFSIPENLFEGESYLQIKDKFLDEKVSHFTQRSANEGFLFVLFYFALFVTDKTPKFFAIDNVEASLNPKLCTKLVKSMAELAKKHDKQVILTTHSPAILDGLDLNDPEQKLFVVYRNKLGHTVVNQVEKPKPLEGQEPIRLSEAFLRGYIGGLPKNFSL